MKPAAKLKLAALGAGVLLLTLWPQVGLSAARQGLIVWAGALVPALFPYCFLAIALQRGGLGRLLGRKLGGLARVLGCPEDGAGAIVCGWLGGNPTGAALTAICAERGGPRAAYLRLAWLSSACSPAFALGALEQALPGAGWTLLVASWLGILASAVPLRLLTSNSAIARRLGNVEPLKGSLANARPVAATTSGASSTGVSRSNSRSIDVGTTGAHMSRAGSAAVGADGGTKSHSGSAGLSTSNAHSTGAGTTGAHISHASSPAVSADGVTSSRAGSTGFSTSNTRSTGVGTTGAHMSRAGSAAAGADGGTPSRAGSAAIGAAEATSSRAGSARTAYANANLRAAEAKDSFARETAPASTASPAAASPALEAARATLLVGCWVVLFSVLSAYMYLGVMLLAPGLPPIVPACMHALMEMAGGSLTLAELPGAHVLPLVCFAITFGGLSIGMQALSLLRPVGIPSGLYLLGKAVQGVLAALICAVLSRAGAAEAFARATEVLPSPPTAPLALVALGLAVIAALLNRRYIAWDKLNSKPAPTGQGAHSA